MSSMRQVLAKTLHEISLRTGNGLRRAKAQRKARILMYHGIGKNEVSAELFAWQLTMLRNDFELVSLRNLLERRTHGTLTGSEVAITFDDGVRNHATQAYPILREHRAPATFFVCPGLMDAGSWIWNIEFRCRLELLSSRERAPLVLRLGGFSSDTEDLVARVKRLDLAQRRQAESWVREHTKQFSPTPEQIGRYSPLTWDQLRGLDETLITVGSHTLNHPILTTLSPAEIFEEISTSRSLLEQRLERRVELFCYPNGDHDDRVCEQVQAVYAAAVTTVPGVVGDHESICRLSRIPAGEARGLFVRRLHRPAA